MRCKWRNKYINFNFTHGKKIMHVTMYLCCKHWFYFSTWLLKGAQLLLLDRLRHLWNIAGCRAGKGSADCDHHRQTFFSAKVLRPSCVCSLLAWFNLLGLLCSIKRYSSYLHMIKSSKNILHPNH